MVKEEQMTQAYEGGIGKEVNKGKETQPISKENGKARNTETKDEMEDAKKKKKKKKKKNRC